MINEFIFVIQASCVGILCLIALWLGNSALVALLAAQAIIANLFVLKQITLGGLNATAADIYIVGSCLTLNLLQEYFGKHEARKAIWISFFIVAFYTIMSIFQQWYAPSPFDTAHDTFCALLQFMPRITLASMTTYIVVQYSDSYVYGVLKNITNGRFLIWRNYATVGLSQLLDTLLFTILGLAGTVSNLWQIMIVSYLIKLVALILLTPFISLTKTLMRRS